MGEQQIQNNADQTILIAEDDELLAAAIAETLDLQGLETIIANDGEQALTMVRTLRPDVIFLDVMMPGMSGIEVCNTLKADPETARIPVIFITAMSEQADRLIGIAAGATEYLTKPFSPTELITLVNKLLAGHLPYPQTSPPDLSEMPTDQLAVYARELSDLFEQEQHDRQALEKARERLSELDRLKADFLSTVTHELLTPFANIGLPIQVLQRQSETFSPEQRETLDNLTTEIAYLHRLINGVVKFAGLVNKQREPQPGRVSLNQIIPWAVQPVAILARSREIDFRVWTPADLPKAFADPELLGEAIFQMSHNAVKFNMPGGQAQVRAFESGERVVIQVTDTGVGLTLEQLAALGEPFQQSADVLLRGQEGLGIGWTFVRYVAEVHGGWTRVESKGPDQGSTFTLALPTDSNRRG